MTINLIKAIIGALVIIGTFTYPPGRLCLFIFKTYIDPKPSIKDRLLCFAPVYNLQLIREILYGSSPIYKALSIGFGIYVLFFLIVRFILGVSSGLGIVLNLVVSSINMFIMLPLLYGASYKVIWDVAWDYDAVTLRAYGLFIPVGFYFAVGRMQRYFKNNPDALEEVFDE